MAGIDRSLSSEGLSLYKLLDLEKTATDNEIKKAYHKKALRCHPDKNPGDSAKAEEFQKINNASNILRDERKRKVYDKMGSQGLQIIDTAGLEVAEAIMKYDSPWYKAIFITCFCFTGCCFGCCCCCFLCCCCCGKLKPKQDTEDPLIPESDDEKEEGNNHATTTGEFSEKAFCLRNQLSLTKIYSENYLFPS